MSQNSDFVKDLRLFAFTGTSCSLNNIFSPASSYLVLGRGGFGFGQVRQERGRTARAVQFGQVLHDRVQRLLLI